ncbi:MAG: Gfo/Idh/MocA family oxidoreductase [Parcubacteria group bacterium]|nr:Gfo/Idh/MocA family oxidoreductase [Parcubacteria group bacterium]
MIKRTRVAVIGAGRWGKKIIGTLKILESVTVSYIAEYDYSTLLNKEDIDAVIVATPAATHAKVALPFIKKGLSVFIEKPMVTNVAEALVLARAARKSGARVFVGHLHLYNPAYLKTKQLAKHIGKIRYIFSEGCSSGPVREDVSVLWDWGSHDVYMLLDLLLESPIRVLGWEVSHMRSKSTLYDTTYAKLYFKNGTIAFMFNSWMFPEKRKRMTIVGEKSTIVFDEMAKKKITVYKNVGLKKRNNVTKQGKEIITHPSYNKILPLTAELKAFLTMIKTNKKPKTDIKNGIATVRVLEAIERSISANSRSIFIKKLQWIR